MLAHVFKMKEEQKKNRQKLNLRSKLIVNFISFKKVPNAIFPRRATRKVG